MITNRLDWTIRHMGTWVATYKTGEYLIAKTKEDLMRKINNFRSLLHS